MADSHVSWFQDVGLAQRPEVGGKGGSLGELTRAGHPVPPGFVVRTAAFERHIEVLERAAPLRAVVATLDPDDLDALRLACAALRERVERSPLPPDVEQEVLAAHAALCQGAPVTVAVRSSATTEDAADASFAGLQDTYLWVREARDVLHKVRSCWASLYSVDSVSYRLRKRFPESEVAMAVVVQAMVDARTAGVMFTRSPTTGDRSVITIEGAWGLGSAVVSGEVTPDRWVVGKITGEITRRDISPKLIRHVPGADGVEEQSVPADLRDQPCLSDEELQALRSVGRAVERHYGCPQDIEWAVDRSGRIQLLQSRPETVWASRQAAPVARAIDDPLRHVMTIFGGRG